MWRGLGATKANRGQVATENASVGSIEKSGYDRTRIRGRSTNEDLARTEHGPSCPACSEMVGMENVRGGRHRPGVIQKESLSGMGEAEKDLLGGKEWAESTHR